LSLLCTLSGSLFDITLNELCAWERLAESRRRSEAPRTLAAACLHDIVKRQPLRRKRPERRPRRTHRSEAVLEHSPGAVVCKGSSTRWHDYELSEHGGRRGQPLGASAADVGGAGGVGGGVCDRIGA